MSFSFCLIHVVGGKYNAGAKLRKAQVFEQFDALLGADFEAANAVQRDAQIAYRKVLGVVLVEWAGAVAGVAIQTRQIGAAHKFCDGFGKVV